MITTDPRHTVFRGYGTRLIGGILLLTALQRLPDLPQQLFLHTDEYIIKQILQDKLGAVFRIRIQSGQGIRIRIWDPNLEFDPAPDRYLA